MPKVAIFYDWLNQWGGAEKVLLDILAIYPQAPVYTLVHQKDKTPWLPDNTQVITSFINQLPFAVSNPVYYTPLYPLAVEQFDFSAYDIVISLTTTVGHCLITPPSTLFICYFLNINRHIYNRSNLIANLYKRMDQVFKHRPDYLLADSQTVRDRLRLTYGLDSQVVYPGVDTDTFTPAKNSTQKSEKYFLTVSRLVPHKKIDLAIRACQKTGHQLFIVGDGRQKKYLQQLALSTRSPHIRFLGKVSLEKLIDLYRHCQALVCPQEEDFGLTALEAQACGKPVIAYGRGGITETVKENKTGVFFKSQTVDCLKNTLQNFDPSQFKMEDCTKNASRFSTRSFMLNFNQSITHLWEKHLLNQITT